MNTKEKADLLLEEFARSRGIEGLAFGEDGDCALVDEEDRVIHVQLDGESGRLICLAALGGMPSPAGCRPEILYDLLAANFCWGSSCGATLAIEPQSGQVIIQHALSVADADSAAFSRFIEGFIQLTVYWEGRLSGIQAAHADDGSPFSAAEDEGVTETMIRV